MKKIIVIVLILCLIGGVFLAYQTGLIEDLLFEIECFIDDLNPPQKALNYRLSDDGDSYLIVGATGYSSGDEVVIPDTYEGKPVSAIEENAFKYKWFSSITIPNSVKFIGASAFQESKLTSITIPDSVTYIGEKAFHDCDSLTSVTFGENSQLTSIGSDAFNNCTALESITIPNSVTSIGSDAFNNCSTLKSITIPDSVTSISEGMFFGCNSLESITLPFVGSAIRTSSDTYQYPFGYVFGTRSYPGGVVTKQFFYGRNLTEETYSYYYIPETLKTVEITGGNILYGAFYYCNGLTSVTMGDEVLSIGDYAFFDCTSLTNVTIGNSISVIGDFAFKDCVGLTSITIGNNVKSIGYSAFINCTALENITIPDSVTNIDAFAFKDCSSLVSITIPNSVTSIYGATFSGCEKLIQKENGISYIDRWAVDCNTSVTTVVLRENTVGILANTFESCSNLTNISIPDSVISIDSSTFKDCSSLVYNEYDNAYYLGNAKNPFHALISIKSTNITSCEIHKNTKIICDDAFRHYNSNLMSITIPNGVTSIGDYAFYGCSNLTSITIPDSITSIGKYAFNACKGLKNVTIPNRVTSIAVGMFENCSGLTSITIPNSIISINNYAFRDCTNLTSVTLPDTITFIGACAFDDCNNLTDIIFEGTIEQWKAIYLSIYWNRDIWGSEVTSSNGTFSMGYLY